MPIQRLPRKPLCEVRWCLVRSQVLPRCLSTPQEQQMKRLCRNLHQCKFQDLLSGCILLVLLTQGGYLCEPGAQVRAVQ